MFPAERPAVLNSIARGVMGRSASIQGGSISNLLDKSVVEKIAISTWQKFWDKFLIFGNISAGIMGIYLGVRIFKLVLDTIVHGYALHTVYGWSIYLIGAIWDSLTQLLLHLRRAPLVKEPTTPSPDPQKNEPEQVIYTEVKKEHDYVYPSLPTKQNSNYTLQLRE
ncbi:hypothetical protein ACS0PU_004208 [Formica fusca]